MYTMGYGSNPTPWAIENIRNKYDNLLKKELKMEENNIDVKILILKKIYLYIKDVMISLSLNEDSELDDFLIDLIEIILKYIKKLESKKIIPKEISK